MGLIGGTYRNGFVSDMFHVILANLAHVLDLLENIWVLSQNVLQSQKLLNKIR
jgi:hypothetical protein